MPAPSSVNASAGSVGQGAKRSVSARRQGSEPSCASTPGRVHSSFGFYSNRQRSATPMMFRGRSQESTLSGCRHELEESYNVRIALLEEELDEVRRMRKHLEAHRKSLEEKWVDTHSAQPKAPQKSSNSIFIVPKLYQGTPLARSRAHSEPPGSTGKPATMGKGVQKAPLPARDREPKSRPKLDVNEEPLYQSGSFLVEDVPCVYSFGREKKFTPIIRDRSVYFFDCSHSSTRRTPGPGSYTPRYAKLSKTIGKS